MIYKRKIINSSGIDDLDRIREVKTEKTYLAWIWKSLSWLKSLLDDEIEKAVDKRRNLQWTRQDSWREKRKKHHLHQKSKKVDIKSEKAVNAEQEIVSDSKSEKLMILEKLVGARLEKGDHLKQKLKKFRKQIVNLEKKLKSCQN